MAALHRTVGRRAAPRWSERIVKAIADIAEAPGGLLLLVDERRPASASPPAGTGAAICPRRARTTPALIASSRRAATSSISPAFATDGCRTDEADRGAAPLARGLDGAWAGVPLIHGGRLVGLVVLEHPAVRRPLDWEDFDLFRTAGIQAATYLAEAHSQEALADARRFDEFNRRFAFILHDIKNLVSQLSLVARNAERHADNPEFREDMIATLHSSVKKMNDLLARLSPRRGNVEAEPAARRSRCGRAGGGRRGASGGPHPVEVVGRCRPGRGRRSGPARAGARPSRPERDRRQPGRRAGQHRAAAARRRGDDRDRRPRRRHVGRFHPRPGCSSPSPRPRRAASASARFEARSLIAAMGGRIEVDSREGDGTRFTLFLPLA